MSGETLPEWLASNGFADRGEGGVLGIRFWRHGPVEVGVTREGDVEVHVHDGDPAAAPLLWTAEFRAAPLIAVTAVLRLALVTAERPG